MAAELRRQHVCHFFSPTSPFHHRPPKFLDLLLYFWPIGMNFIKTLLQGVNEIQTALKLSLEMKHHSIVGILLQYVGLEREGKKFDQKKM